MTQMRKLRRLVPPNGRAYELFDSALLLFLLIFVDYVLTPPGPTQQAALAKIFLFVPQVVWGIFTSCFALYGIVAAYFPRLVTSGYRIAIGACVFWCGLFFVGMFRPEIHPLRAFTTLVLYGWICRRLWREEDRNPPRTYRNPPRT